MVTARKKENVVAIRNGVVCLVSARDVPWEVNRRQSAPHEVSVWTERVYAPTNYQVMLVSPQMRSKRRVVYGRRCLGSSILFIIVIIIILFDGGYTRVLVLASID